MDPINIPPMLAYIPYMDPMGFGVGFDNPKLIPPPKASMERQPCGLEMIALLDMALLGVP